MIYIKNASEAVDVLDAAREFLLHNYIKMETRNRWMKALKNVRCPIYFGCSVLDGKVYKHSAGCPIAEMYEWLSTGRIPAKVIAKAEGGR